MKLIAICTVAMILAAGGAESLAQTSRPATEVEQSQSMQIDAPQQRQASQAGPTSMPAPRQRVEEQLGQLTGDLPQYYAGWMAMLRKKNKKASKLYAKFLVENPSSKKTAEALYGLAVVLQRMGKHEEAIKHLNDLATRFPKDPLVDDALLKIGQIYEDDLKNFKEATKAYKRVMKLHDGYGQLRGASRLGRQFIGQKKIQAANVQYQVVLDDAHKRNLATRNNFVYSEAANHARFIDGNNDFDFKPLEMYFEAREHFRVGEYKNCRLKLDSLGTKYPSARILDDAAMLTADTFRRRGELAKANAAYESLVHKWSDSPHAATAWFRIGEFNRMADNLVAARIAYENALKLTPHNSAPNVHELARNRLKEITKNVRKLPNRSY